MKVRDCNIEEQVDALQQEPGPGTREHSRGTPDPSLEPRDGFLKKCIKLRPQGTEGMSWVRNWRRRRTLLKDLKTLSIEKDPK